MTQFVEMCMFSVYQSSHYLNLSSTSLVQLKDSLSFSSDVFKKTCIQLHPLVFSLRPWYWQYPRFDLCPKSVFNHHTFGLVKNNFISWPCPSQAIYSPSVTFHTHLLISELVSCLWFLINCSQLQPAYSKFCLKISPSAMRALGTFSVLHVTAGNNFTKCLPLTGN